MKVVWLTSYSPYPPDFGGARRVFNLVAQASFAGHSLHLLCFSSGSAARDAVIRENLEELVDSLRLVRDPDALPAALGDSDKEAVARKRRGQLRSLISPRPYQFRAHYSEAMQRELADTLRRVRPTLLQVEYSQMGYYGFPRKLPALLDLHNVEHEVLERAARQGDGGVLRRFFNYVEYLKFSRDERRIWGKFTGLLTTSERDGELVRRQLPQARPTVVPNGVDASYFHPAEPRARRERTTIIFTGMMAYFPNVDGVLFFNREIWPQVRSKAPSTHWVIMGSDPLPEVQALAAESVEVTGWVEDVRPGVWDAGVVVVPLRVGGGTRLKIVEALAMGKAIVSTSIGCEGLDVVDGVHLLVRDDPAAFADAVVLLLNDPRLRARLGAAGRELALRKYDWSVTARPMLRTWEEMAGNVMRDA